jgi:protein-tyrosine phosphatase
MADAAQARGKRPGRRGAQASQRPISLVEDGRPWRRATAWLAGLSVFFYASYSFSNWLASQRAGVPVVVYDWEHTIPFVAWMIIPYWSTNLLFAVSLFFCRSRSELDSHAKRLLTAQVVAVSCFILFPLRTSFPVPKLDGIFSFFFAALGAFDLPYNQAPSLHIAVTTILFALYGKVLPRWAVPLFAGWSLLVVGSVLMTYQHHFIDIPTGLLLGLVCIWMWPSDGGNRLLHWRLTDDPQRRRIAGLYALAAGAMLLPAALLGGGSLWLMWPATALGAVSLAYLALGCEVFAKSVDGRIDWPSRLILAPYLAGAWLKTCLWTRAAKRTVEVADGVFLGRFPSVRDGIEMKSVVDLSCASARPAFQGQWISIPMLDLVAPEPESLCAAVEAIERARPRGSVLVCTGADHGQGAAVLAVWLVRTGRAAHLEAGLDLLRGKDTRLVPTSAQVRVMTAAVQYAVAG